MSQNIGNSAKLYLDDTPDDWVQLIQNIARQSKDWINKSVDDENKLKIKTDIYEGAVEKLLVPQFVRMFVGAKEDSNIDNLVEIFVESLSQNIFEFSDAYKDGEEILDFGWDGASDEFLVVQPAHNEDNEYRESEMHLSPYIISGLEIDLDDYKKHIKKYFFHAAEVVTPTEIYRLSEIKLTLYKALSENPELMHSLNWRTFEKLLADILDTFGYEVELQQGSKDGGIDIFAIKALDPFGPQKFLLQAKRWKNKVGVDPVRQLAFLHDHHRVTKSCLATTSAYTQGAWELANQYKWQMELRDMHGIHEWIKEAVKLKR